MTPTTCPAGHACPQRVLAVNGGSGTVLAAVEATRCSSGEDSEEGWGECKPPCSTLQRRTASRGCEWSDGALALFVCLGVMGALVLIACVVRHARRRVDVQNKRDVAAEGPEGQMPSEPRRGRGPALQPRAPPPPLAPTIAAAQGVPMQVALSPAVQWQPQPQPPRHTPAPPCAPTPPSYEPTVSLRPSAEVAYRYVIAADVTAAASAATLVPPPPPYEQVVPPGGSDWAAVGQSRLPSRRVGSLPPLAIAPTFAASPALRSSAAPATKAAAAPRFCGMCGAALRPPGSPCASCAMGDSPEGS